MLLHSTIPTDMFAKEKGIILEELAKDRSNPEYEATLFEGKTLWATTRRPSRARHRSVDHRCRATRRAFYHRRYRPEAMTMVVMGDFDVPRRAPRSRSSTRALPQASAKPPRPEFGGADAVAKQLHGSAPRGCA